MPAPLGPERPGARPSMGSIQMAPSLRPLEPVAIVGSSCRFAGGATSPSKLWSLLSNPVDLSQPVPPSRFNMGAFYSPEDGERPGMTNSPQAYFLSSDDSHKAFDASFFSITPREAEAMDPQHRLALEVVFEAVEAAGITLEQLRGRTVDVFAGLMTADYDTIGQRDELHASQYYATGTARTMAANRISYFFDLRGASVSIDTACSASMVGLHQAVASLRLGHAEMAIVTGANLILAPDPFAVEASLHMLSLTGRCRMWDAAADGYARGEGVAAIIVKPLSSALRDGDHIEAVIRETGCNSDGRTKGITSPSWEAQSQLIRDVYRRAGLDIRSPAHRCQYFEAHGTGTPAGDPTEARAISAAFFGERNPHFAPGPILTAPEIVNKPLHKSSSPESTIEALENNKLFVGSVKTVIGHTEGAAGLAGLLKVVQAMNAAVIPPNLHLNKLSPTVEPFCRNLIIPTEARPWPEAACGQPRRASVNSFGFGGTNAHAIVEMFDPAIHGVWVDTRLPPSLLLNSPPATRVDEFMARETEPGTSGVYLPLVLSAASPTSLARLVERYRDWIQADTSVGPVQLAWQAYTKRSAFDHRVTVSAAASLDLVAKLNDLTLQFQSSAAASDDGGALATPLPFARAHPSFKPPKILGIFTGQGAQWISMARMLYTSHPGFAQTIQTLDDILRQSADPPPATWTLVSQLLADKHTSRLHDPRIAQPLCSAVQVALVAMLRSLGVRFRAVVGHSSGEIAAAFAAGRISARDAVLIAYYRGMFTQLVRGAQERDDGSSDDDGRGSGEMLACGLTLGEAQSLCARPEYCGRIWVAASNSPSLVTLSGYRDVIDAVYKELGVSRPNILVKILGVAMAYHSPIMGPAAHALLHKLKACGIDYAPCGQNAESPVAWVSTCSSDGSEPDAENGKAQYWADNMLRPVLFHEAVSRAVQAYGPFDCAVEVGPHPAMKSSVLDTVKTLAVTKSPGLREQPTAIPYSGVLRRNTDDRLAFSEFLAFMWTRFGSCDDQIRRFIEGAVSQPQFTADRPSLLASPPVDNDHARARSPIRLPHYPWDHSQLFWRESRVSRQYQFRTGPPHELLGARTRDDTPFELRWRNVLALDRVPWLRHHAFQGQPLLPASAYLVMAVDAAREAARLRFPDERRRRLALVDLLDVEFEKGILFDAATAADGVEVLFSLRLESSTSQDALAPESGSSLSAGRSQKEDDEEKDVVMSASFMASSCVADGRSPMKMNCRGRVVLVFSSRLSAQALPPRPELRPETSPFHPDEFYKMMRGLGLGYSGPFRSIAGLSRCFNYSCATVPKRSPHADETRSLTISPSCLDSCLQSAFVTWAAPGDGSLWISFLPVSIRRARFNLALCDSQTSPPPDAEPPMLTVDAYLTSSKGFTAPNSAARMTVDTDIYNAAGQMEIQLEGLTVGSFGVTRPEQDREMYLTTVLDFDIDDEVVAFPGQKAVPMSREMLMVKWTGQADRPVGDSERRSVRSNRCSLMENGAEESGQGVVGDGEKGAAQQDAAAAKGLGSRETLPTSIASSVDEQNSAPAWDAPALWRHVQRIAKQAAHKYPRMNVLTLGCDLRFAVGNVLVGLGEAFLNLFVGRRMKEDGEEVLGKLSESVRRRLHIEQLSLGQEAQGIDGWNEAVRERVPFDFVVLTSLSLSNDSSLDNLRALRKIRELMRPGGFLLMIHPHSQDADNCSSTWRHVLQQAGFVMGPVNSDQDNVSGAVSVSIRLAPSPEKLRTINYFQGFCDVQLTKKLLLIGSLDEASSITSDDENDENNHALLKAATLTNALSPYCGAITAARALDDVTPEASAEATAVILLSDLSSADPVMSTAMTDARMDVLRALMRPEMVMLWLTHRSRDANCWQAASYGFARTLLAEVPSLALQMLDLDTLVERDAVAVVADTFARLALRGVSPDDSMGEKTMTDRAVDRVVKPLRTKENEVFFQNGQRMIPRLLPWKEANDRLNSFRRVITAETSTADKCVAIAQNKATGLLEMCVDESTIISSSHIATHFTSPLLLTRDRFVCIGRGCHGDEPWQVAISSKNASVVAALSLDMKKDSSLTNVEDLVEDSHLGSDLRERAARLAGLVSRYLAALAMRNKTSDNISTGEHVETTSLFIDPDELSERCIRRVFDERGLAYRIFTTNVNHFMARAGKKDSVHFMHARSSMRELEALFPPSQGHVYSFLSSAAGREELQRSLQEVVNKKGGNGSGLSSSLRYLFHTVLPLSDDQTCGYSTITSWMWKKAVQLARSDLSAQLNSAPTTALTMRVIPVSELLRNQTDSLAAHLAIHDWTKTLTLTRSILPNGEGANAATKPLLSPDKIYIIAGLTRDIGHSLCELFFSLGGRRFFLVSRHPPTQPPQWQLALQRRGVDVRFASVDITSRAEVQAFKATLGARPDAVVGGVVNGAMVLDDGVFATMRADTFNRVMLPKTVGSQVLDEAFRGPALDFFILTSSFAAAGGHAGQANYAAANMFMNALAARRRHNGLAASAVNIGVIYGLGYLMRENKAAVYAMLERDGYPPVSERDLHHMFVEAIVAGRPAPAAATSPRGIKEAEPAIYDITTGLRRFDANHPTLAWHFDARFSHFTRATGDDESGSDESEDVESESEHSDDDKLLSSLPGSTRTLARGGKSNNKKRTKPGKKSSSRRSRTLGTGSSSSSSGAQTLKARLAATGTARQMSRDVLLPALATHLQAAARLARAPGADDEVDRLGLDSLMATQVRGWAYRAAGVDIPVLRMLQARLTLGALCDVAVEGLVERRRRRAEERRMRAGKDAEEEEGEAGEQKDGEDEEEAEDEEGEETILPENTPHEGEEARGGGLGLFIAAPPAGPLPTRPNSPAAGSVSSVAAHSGTEALLRVPALVSRSVSSVEGDDGGEA